MNTTSIPDKNAFQHIEVLASEIGPRPAGSEAEKKALDYIAGQLSTWGYALKQQAVPFAPQPRFNSLYVFAALGLLFSAWTLKQCPGFAFCYPLVIFALPQIARWQSRLRKPAGLSENLIAELPSDIGKPALILCAHVDSARANAIRKPGLLRLYGVSLFVATRAALALAAIGALVLMGLTVPPPIFVFCAIIGSLVSAYWITLEILSQSGHPASYSPGAYDNASGVGTLLALADIYAQKPLDNMRLTFLFTGAEETGMHGARAFIASANKAVIRAVINYDMVGAGNVLRYVAVDGTIWPSRTSQPLNRLIRRVEPAARGIWYALRSGDHLPFIQAGIPTVSLVTSGSRAAEFNYHTINDTLSIIEPACMERVIQFSQNFIKQLDTRS